ncbi:MAG: hypothetical protein Q8L44_10045 [Sulfuritalea sp.]|nr:hypothetical protein [Sulfuritalea sp.]
MIDLLLGLVLTALLLRAAAYLPERVPERSPMRDIRPLTRRSSS